MLYRGECTTAMEELQELITDKNCQDGRVTNDSSQSKLLLDVLQNNDIPSLKSILTQFSVDNLELKSSQKNCKNIVNIACIDESVECEVLSIILSYLNNKYPNLHWSESQWYYWEPIHFVAYSIDCKKLETLLNNYNKTRINALTIFSENAFHVLLHYGKRIESYKVHLTNGWESRACNVTAKEKNDLVECTKLLIAAGVDINHANIWGETPIMLAIKNGYHKILKILLKQKNIELKYGDTGPHSQKSVQDFIKENELSYETLSTPLSVENPCKIVFGLLKSDNEEVFLRYNNGNIKQYANSCDGDSDINTSGTMLQLCFLKGYLEILKRPNTKETIDIKDLINSSYVKLFISKGYVKSIEHLLNNGADVKCKNKMFNFHNLIVVSVKFCYFPFLIILLEHASNQVWSDDIFDVLEKNADELFKYKHHEVVYVFFILLTKLQNLCKCNDVHSTLINYRKKAVLNHTMELCLKYSLKNDFTDVILDNLKLGASLACPTSSNINPLDILDMATLEKHLNECVRNSSYICFDSLILDDIDNYSETIVLSSLIHDESKLELLNHPVLIYLTHCKWLKTNKFFYVDIVVYALFLISLYFYMISLHIDNLRPEITWIFQIFLTVHIIKEITQLCLFTYRYFFDVINYFEAFVLVFSAINCYTKNEVCIVLSILFSTMTFLYMLGQIPRFTKYMIIVSSTKYFFEYALFYFIQFFSFALCFFVLLPPEEEASRTNALGEIFKNLFDCLIYFIGQFDGEVASPVHFPVFGRIIVALFAFCMTIILNNLLVGLIVTDMDTIQKTAKVLRQVKTIKYIIRTEIFLKNLKNLPCFRKIKFIHDTNIFNKGQCKYVNYKFSMYDKRVFDDDDKAKLSQILEQNDLKNSFSKGCLKNFYQHIISESFSHSKINKGSQYILTKLHQLEGVLNRRSMMLN